MGIIGAHVSVAGGLHNGIRNGEKLDCSAIQIFVRNPNRWLSQNPKIDAIEKFRSTWRDSSVSEILVHDIHLTNLASPKPDILSKSRKSFESQIRSMQQLGLRYLNTHLGSHTGSGETQGLETLSESINFLLDQTQDCDVMILLETTAGQGTNLGYKFEHIAQIISDSKFPHRLGVCVDTCHIFAAGYELRTEKTYHETFDEFDRVIGLDRILAFHLNDSKTDYQSRVDRHEHIGQGFIGLKLFELLINDERFEKIPMLLETPIEAHQMNLDLLRNLKKEKIWRQNL